MKDTPPRVERKFRQMLLKRSGEERLKMGCSMHETARALAKAALLQKHPGARPAKLKRLLFLHFYGADFEPGERKRIAMALSKSARRAEATWARAAFGAANAQVDERPVSYRATRPTDKKKLATNSPPKPRTKRAPE